jgi:hypothetical protein
MRYGYRATFFAAGSRSHEQIDVKLTTLTPHFMRPPPLAGKAASLIERETLALFYKSMFSNSY